MPVKKIKNNAQTAKMLEDAQQENVKKGFFSNSFLVTNKFWHIANLLTAARLLFAAIIFTLLMVIVCQEMTIIPGYVSSNIIHRYSPNSYHSYFLILWIVCGVLYIISVTSDFLDGYFARKLKLVSNFGKFFDPLADKILNIICLLVFSIFGIIPLFFTIPLICRDISVTSLRAFAATKKIVIKANFWGKLTTAFINISYICIFFIIPLYSVNIVNLGTGTFFNNSFSFHQGYLVYVILIPFYFALIFSFYSAFGYTKIYLQHKQAIEQKYNQK